MRRRAALRRGSRPARGHAPPPPAWRARALARPRARVPSWGAAPRAHRPLRHRLRQASPSQTSDVPAAREAGHASASARGAETSVTRYKKGFERPRNTCQRSASLCAPRAPALRDAPSVRSCGAARRLACGRRKRRAALAVPLPSPTCGQAALSDEWCDSAVRSPFFPRPPHPSLRTFALITTDNRVITTRATCTIASCDFGSISSQSTPAEHYQTCGDLAGSLVPSCRLSAPVRVTAAAAPQRRGDPPRLRAAVPWPRPGPLPSCTRQTR